MKAKAKKLWEYYGCPATVVIVGVLLIILIERW
jgi:hypothetical protein